MVLSCSVAGSETTHPQKYQEITGLSQAPQIQYADNHHVLSRSVHILYVYLHRIHTGYVEFHIAILSECTVYMESVRCVAKITVPMTSVLASLWLWMHSFWMNGHCFPWLWIDCMIISIHNHSILTSIQSFCNRDMCSLRHLSCCPSRHCAFQCRMAHEAASHVGTSTLDPRSYTID